MSEGTPSQPLVGAPHEQSPTPVSTGDEATQTQGSAAVVAPSSLMPDNPPAYSEFAKEQEAQSEQPPMMTYPPTIPTTVAPAMGPVQYVVAAPVTMTPKPKYPGPHDYLVMIIVVVLICGMLNVTSLLVGIPALVMAVMARGARVTDYSKASMYSTWAIALTIATIILTLCMAILITGLILGFGGDGNRLNCRRLIYDTFPPPDHYRCRNY